jgi:hypothetical protein
MPAAPEPWAETGASEASRPRSAPQQAPYRQQPYRQLPEEGRRGAGDTTSNDEKRADLEERSSLRVSREEHQERERAKYMDDCKKMDQRLQAIQEGNEHLEEMTQKMCKGREALGLWGQMLEQEKAAEGKHEPRYQGTDVPGTEEQVTFEWTKQRARPKDQEEARGPTDPWQRTCGHQGGATTFHGWHPNGTTAQPGAADGDGPGAQGAAEGGAAEGDGPAAPAAADRGGAAARSEPVEDPRPWPGWTGTKRPAAED